MIKEGMEGQYRKILQGPESDPNNTGGRGANGKGFYDYTENKFVMPNGR